MDDDTSPRPRKSYALTKGHNFLEEVRGFLVVGLDSGLVEGRFVEMDSHAIAFGYRWCHFG
jgi:hypothetical protein